jgi:hypothetical protein
MTGRTQSGFSNPAFLKNWFKKPLGYLPRQIESVQYEYHAIVRSLSQAEVGRFLGSGMINFVP